MGIHGLPHTGIKYPAACGAEFGTSASGRPSGTLRSMTMTMSETPTLFDLVPEVPQSSVYYATDGLNIKIGFTSREPRRRGGELKARMILAVPGTMLDERRLHNTWRHLRIGSSEWYRPGPRLLLSIQEQLARQCRCHHSQAGLAILRELLENDLHAAA